jgi:hypothetical protein
MLVQWYFNQLGAYSYLCVPSLQVHISTSLSPILLTMFGNTSRRAAMRYEFSNTPQMSLLGCMMKASKHSDPTSPRDTKSTEGSRRCGTFIFDANPLVNRLRLDTHVVFIRFEDTAPANHTSHTPRPSSRHDAYTPCSCVPWCSAWSVCFGQVARFGVHKCTRAMVGSPCLSSHFESTVTILNIPYIYCIRCWVVGSHLQALTDPTSLFFTSADL